MERIIYTMLLAGLSVTIILSYIYNIYGCKRKIPRIVKNLIIVIYLMYQYILENVKIDPLVVICTNLIIISVVSQILMDTRKKNIALFSVLLYGIWMLIELIVSYILSLTGTFDIEERIAGSFISKVLTLLLIYVGIFHLQIKRYQIHFGFKVGKLFFMAVGSIIIAYTIFKLNVDKTSPQNVLVFSSIIILLFLNIAIFQLYVDIAKQYKANIQSFYYEQLIERYKKESERVEKEYEIIKQIRHDTKSQISYLKYLLKEREYDECIEYLNKISDAKDKYNSQKFCGNRIFNAMLNSVVDNILNKNIDMKYDLNIPSKIFVESVHLCAVLGNVLDNAVEALEKVKDEPRKLYVYSKYCKGVLVIKVKNNYKQPVVTKNKKFISNKKKTELHGMGIESIKRIVNIYNGTVDIDYENNMFSVCIVLYEKEKLHGEGEISTR